MVQWFKKLFVRFKKKNYTPLIEFNMGVHQQFIVNAGDRLYASRMEDGLQLARRVIESNRNMEICALAHLRAGDTITLAKAQGRIEALTALVSYFQDATDATIHKANKQNADLRDQQKAETARFLRMRRGVSAEASI